MRVIYIEKLIYCFFLSLFLYVTFFKKYFLKLYYVYPSRAILLFLKLITE